jgi:3-oxoacyl-[acyl-carrier protein] reductase
MHNYLVITGGSRGIGEKTIALYMKQGWHVINISRTPCKIHNVINLQLDLSNTHWSQEDIQTLQTKIIQANKICLVHNASAFKKDTVYNLTPDDFSTVLNINVITPALLNTLLLPYMKSGSSIIYIGSTLSEMAVANRASYVTSKHALVGLMRSTCQDLAGKHITTCCICPGFVNTDMLTCGVDKQALNAFMKQKVTAQRMIEPEEIAEVIYFCATHPVMNGEVLHANLGQITT